MVHLVYQIHSELYTVQFSVCILHLTKEAFLNRMYYSQLRYCEECILLSSHLEIPILDGAQEFAVVPNAPDKSAADDPEICL